MLNLKKKEKKQKKGETAWRSCPQEMCLLKYLKSIYFDFGPKAVSVAQQGKSAINEISFIYELRSYF